MRGMPHEGTGGRRKLGIVDVKDGDGVEGHAFQREALRTTRFFDEVTMQLRRAKHESGKVGDWEGGFFERYGITGQK